MSSTGINWGKTGDLRARLDVRNTLSLPEAHKLTQAEVAQANACIDEALAAMRRYASLVDTARARFCKPAGQV